MGSWIIALWFSEIKTFKSKNELKINSIIDEAKIVWNVNSDIELKSINKSSNITKNRDSIMIVKISSVLIIIISKNTDTALRPWIIRLVRFILDEPE